MTRALDEVIPRFDVRERHAAWMPAPPEQAYRAARELTFADVPVLRGLMALRGIPAALTGDPLPLDPRRPFVDQALELGFLLLHERPPEELVVGAVGRFWRPAANRPNSTVRTREDFVRFEAPGFAKAAMNFAVRPEGSGSYVETETRVEGTDPGARLRFRAYWLLIGPWSALIRRAMLAAMRRRLAG